MFMFLTACLSNLLIIESAVLLIIKLQLVESACEDVFTCLLTLE